MADLRRFLEAAITAGSRIARGLPGAAGGMGTYFTARDQLSASGTDYDWRRDVDSMLAHSDRAYTAGRIDSALRWFDKALHLSYHSALHSGGDSPLVENPQAFLGPLRSSLVGGMLLEASVSESRAPRRPSPRDQGPGDRIRLLVLAQQNWTFLRPLLNALRETGRYEILEIEVEGLAEGERPERERILRGRYDLVATGKRMTTPARLVEAYDWADVAFVEWGHHVLTWVSLLDAAPRRLIARYHRFEVFTPFPLLHDHDRIDQILYVSPPIRHLVETVAPAAAATNALYVGNLLSRGIGSMPEGARDHRVLVQVGWNREIKDVLFSLEVIERLRRHDERYRLYLVGPGLPDTPEQDTPYQRRVRERMATLDPEAVEQLGVRRDVPEIFAAAGFVISSSNGEGTHESVMEGLATGCPAVVRNWPHARGYGGAASVYQPGWVVADADQAVQRVLELQDPVRYGAESAAAREWVVGKRHPDTVVAAYEQALRPGMPDT